MPSHAEGLVVEFDEAYTAFVDGFERLPSESQLTALQAVDAKLASMVRAKDASLWTLRACREDPCWGEVRTLAHPKSSTLINATQEALTASTPPR